MDLKVDIVGMTIDSKDVGGEEPLFRECKKVGQAIGKGVKYNSSCISHAPSSPSESGGRRWKVKGKNVVWGPLTATSRQLSRHFFSPSRQW
nr:hypothetical protein Iba_chr12dCG14510 [Ipomoea batatas]